MTGVRVAVTAPPATGYSGVADYAALLGKELERRGFVVAPAGDHELAVLNFTPYAGGVYLGWLRAVRESRALRRGGRPLITVFHEVFAIPDDRLRMRIFGRLQGWAHRRLVRTSVGVVVSDDVRARSLEAIVPGARPTIVAVGPNIPVPAAAPARAPGATIATFGLPHPLRDLDTFVRAAALVVGQTPAARFVLLGDWHGDQAAATRLDALARELGARVEITGPLPAEEVARRLSEARVFVSTYTESLSLGSGGLAAALGHGAVVVAYEGARLSPPLVAGTHLLVAPRDPTGLAGAIATALSEAADAVGAGGRALYEEAASWEAIGARFEELIAGAVSR